MPREYRRRVSSVEIQRAESAQRLELTARSVQTGFVPTPVNQSSEVLRSLGGLAGSLDTRADQEQRDRINQDSQRGASDALLGRDQDPDGSEEYIQAYVARQGAVAGVETSRGLLEIYEENKNNGESLEQFEARLRTAIDEEIKGEDDPLFLENYSKKTEEAVQSLLGTYQEYNRKQTQVAALEDIAIDFNYELDTAASVEELAGTYQGFFEDLTELQNFTAREANDFLVNLVTQKAAINTSPELLDALSLVETPNGPLGGLPKFEAIIEETKARVENEQERLQNEIIADQKKANAVRLFKAGAQGEAIPESEIIDLVERGVLDIGPANSYLTRLENARQSEIEGAQLQSLYQMGAYEYLTPKELQAQVDRDVSNAGSIDEILDIVASTDTVPTADLNQFKYSDPGTEGYDRTIGAFREYLANPEAAAVLARKIGKKYEELDQYNFLVNVAGHTPDAALDLIHGADENLAKGLTVKQRGSLRKNLDFPDSTLKDDPYFLSNVERTAESYIAAGVPAEAAIERSADIFNKTHTTYRGKAFPHKIMPFTEKQFDPALEHYFESGGFQKDFKNHPFSKVLDDTSFDNAVITVDAQTNLDGTLSLKFDEYSYQSVLRIDPYKIVREYEDMKTGQAKTEAVSRIRENGQRKLDSMRGLVRGRYRKLRSRLDEESSPKFEVTPEDFQKAVEPPKESTSLGSPPVRRQRLQTHDN